MDRERLYARLPLALQNLAIGWESRRLARLRFNAEFDRLLAEYESRSFWPADRVAAWRDRRLAEFVAAAAQTPHYRDLFRARGFDPASVRTLDDLAQLPVLTKAEVQAATARFTAPLFAPRDTMPVHTSGSTGGGLRFPTTRRGHREQWAVWERYHRWHGFDRRTWCLYFGGRSIVPARQKKPPFWRVNRAGRQILFSAYHLSPATAPAYLEAMRASGAPWIHGYPSYVALIAGYALEHGASAPVRWVTLGAENVLPSQADIIARAFGVRPREHYGMAEAVANISECPLGKLHVDEDFSAVEFIPQGDGAYSVVGTNFTNPAFPLVRYEVGDVVTIADGACSCGRPGRVVERIDGRQEDFIVTRANVRLGRLDHVFKDLVRVREAQLVQHAIGEMTIRVVRGPGYSDADEAQLRAEVLKRVGQDVAFEIEYVDELPRTARGKLRFVVSTLECGQLSGNHN